MRRSLLTSRTLRVLFGNQNDSNSSGGQFVWQTGGYVVGNFPAPISGSGVATEFSLIAANNGDAALISLDNNNQVVGSSELKGSPSPNLQRFVLNTPIPYVNGGFFALWCPPTNYMYVETSAANAGPIRYHSAQTKPNVGDNLGVFSTWYTDRGLSLTVRGF